MQIRLTPCSRIRTAVCMSCIWLPRISGQLPRRLFKHSRMTARREGQADPGRGQDPADEASCPCRSPRCPENARVRTDPQKPITDVPGEQGGGRIPICALGPTATKPVVFGSLIRRVHEEVRVAHQHSLVLHDAIELVPVTDLHQVASAVPRGERRIQWTRSFLCRPFFCQHEPEARFHLGRHRGLSAGGFFAQTAHDRIVDVQGRFQIE